MKHELPYAVLALSMAVYMGLMANFAADITAAGFVELTALLLLAPAAWAVREAVRESKRG